MDVQKKKEQQNHIDACSPVVLENNKLYLIKRFILMMQTVEVSLRCNEKPFKEKSHHPFYFRASCISWVQSYNHLKPPPSWRDCLCQTSSCSHLEVLLNHLHAADSQSCRGRAVLWVLNFNAHSGWDLASAATWDRARILPFAGHFYQAKKKKEILIDAFISCMYQKEKIDNYSACHNPTCHIETEDGGCSGVCVCMCVYQCMCATFLMAL